MHFKQLPITVTGGSPVAVSYAENKDKKYSVRIDDSQGGSLTFCRVIVQYRSRGDIKHQEFTSKAIIQPKKLHCIYTVEMKDFWGRKYYFKFSLGLQSVKNLNYRILKQDDYCTRNNGKNSR